MSAGTHYVRTADDLEGGATITLLAKGCAEVLERHYPSWMWAIEPDAKQGIINIYSLRISGKWAYTLHIATIQNDPNLKDVLRAGGELLERFGFRRVGYSYSEWSRREQVCGKFIPDVIDKGRFEQRRARAEKIRAQVAGGVARILTDESIGAALRAQRHA